MIEIQNLSLKFKGLIRTQDNKKTNHLLLKDISAKIYPGSSVAIVGPNGSGKTSFLKLIYGEMKPSSGFIKFYNNDLNQVSYLPTNLTIEKNFPISVLDFVLFGFHESSNYLGQLTSDQQHFLEKALNRFEINHIINHPLSKISAGQLQRAALARIYLENKRVILLDEPFNTLDSKASMMLIQTITEWQSMNKIILTVLHNKELVKKYFRETLFISPSYVAFGPTHFVLGNAPPDLSIKSDLELSSQEAIEGTLQ